MENKEYKRLWRIEAPGLDQVISKVKILTQEIELQKAIMKEAQKVLLANKGDTDVMERQSRIIAQSRGEIAKHNAEKRIAVREAELLIKSVERLKNAEITQAAAANHAAGSVNAAAASYKALLALSKAAGTGTLINWQGEQIGIDQAKVKMNEYRTVVDDFNRSLSPDGTLVGEYRKGIMNAFADMGLTDLIKDQKLKLEIELSKTIDENKRLVANFREVGREGPKAFERINPEIDRNLHRIRQLEAELKDVNEVLEKQGGIGKSVTTAIGQGFKQMIAAGAGIFGITIGLQQMSNLIRKSFGTNLKIDSFNSALKLVSKTELELAKNQNFLNEETERLGLELLSTTTAYKNFYTASTQAGIGANSTREIFTAVASTAAQLKLSQDDVNGVFTAFGQIASKGKVQAEELRGQIGERIPGAFSIAARAIGVTEQELNKMLETGKVMSVDFLPKFAAELQKTFGGDTTERIEGLQAATNRFQNALTRLFASNTANQFYTSILDGAAEVLDFFGNATQSTDELGREIEKTQRKSEKYQASLGPLLSRYDELKGKTNLNAEEQEELRSIIDQIIRIVPGAATEFDNYGRALDINKGKVLEFASANDKLSRSFRLTNIKQFEEDAKISIDAAKRFTDQLNQGFAVDEKTVGASARTQRTNVPLLNADGSFTPRGNEVYRAQQQATRQALAAATEILKQGGKLEGDLLAFVQRSGDYKIKVLQRVEEINRALDNATEQAGKALMAGDEKKRLELVETIKKLREERAKLLDPTSVDPVKPTGPSAEEQAEAARQAAAIAKQLLDKRLREVDNQYLLDQMDLYKQFHVDQTINEEQYQQGLYNIEKKAAEQKIKLMQDSSAGQKSEIDKMKFDLLKAEQELNDTLFDLRKKELDRLQEQQIDAAEQQADVILNDVNATAAQKAAAKLNLDNALLKAQEGYNAAMDRLEKEFKKKSEENERERNKALRDMRAQINKDLAEQAMEGFNEQLSIIDTEETKAIAERALKLRGEVQKILDSKSSSGKKSASLEKAKDNAGIELLDIAIDADKRRLEIFKKMLADKKISQIDYDRFLESLANKQIERELKNAQRSEEIEKRKQEFKQLAIQSAEELVDEVLSGFFSANENRINRERDVAIERLELEKKQVLARAQSAAEREAIDKEYDSRRAKLEKEAGERLKKQKKSEATLSLATELANIAAAASNPAANIATLGAYAALYYGLQSALAFARFGFRMNEINNTQFEFGGMPKKGGRIGGRPHSEGGTPFLFGGEPYEAEETELAIIRTKNAPKGQKFTISGTHEQIASALNRLGGGVNFAPGGKYRRLEYGGSLGANLRAPVNPAAFLNTSSGSEVSKDEFNTLMSVMIGMTDSINSRIDRMEVVQDPRAAMRAQSKIVNNNSLASL